MKPMIAILILCIVSAGASAQSAVPPAYGSAGMEHAMRRQLEKRFAAANTTRDGKLTREQAATGMPMVASHFDAIDTQHTGYVTLSRIEDFIRQQSMAH
jgi:hypothetical protein